MTALVLLAVASAIGGMFAGWCAYELMLLGNRMRLVLELLLGGVENSRYKANWVHQKEIRPVIKATIALEDELVSFFTAQDLGAAYDQAQLREKLARTFEVMAEAHRRGLGTVMEETLH